MQIRLRRLCLVGTLVMISACGPGLADDATGEEIYSSSCARCHGTDLAGNGVIPPLGAGSEAAEKDDAALQQTIARGRGRMPSFGNQLTPEQLGRVLDYLRQQQAE